MSDHIPSPYAPREFDCTGDPACWPCGTGHEVIRAVDPAQRCETVGCRNARGTVTSRTIPSLALFCRDCRDRGSLAIYRGSATLETVADWVRVGPRQRGRAPGSGWCAP